MKKEEKILSEAELRLQKLQIEEVPRNPGDKGPRRLTAEENRTIIRLYGGIMFPDDNMVTTPKNMLFEPREFSAASSNSLILVFASKSSKFINYVFVRNYIYDYINSKLETYYPLNTKLRNRH